MYVPVVCDTDVQRYSPGSVAERDSMAGRGKEPGRLLLPGPGARCHRQ